MTIGMKRPSIVLALAVTVLLANAAVAENITIKNQSFENPTLAEGTWTTNSIPDWTPVTAGGNVGVWHPGLATTYANNPGVTQDFIDGAIGENVAYSNGGNIRQDLPIDVGSGYLYTLKVRVGGRIGYSNEPYGLLMRADPDGPGGTATLTMSGIYGRNVADTWLDRTVTYEAVDPAYASQKLVIVLSNSGTTDADLATDGVQVNFDDIRLMRQRLVSCEGFLAPFDKPLSLKRNDKRAIPVKMRLYDYSGNELTDGDFAVPPVVNVMMQAGGTTIEAIPSGELVSAGLAEDGNSFRYDPIAGIWIINLAAKMYTTPGTYVVNVEMGDAEFAIQSTATCTGTFVRQ